MRDMQPNDVIPLLEQQGFTHRHLQVRLEKPCVTAYLTGYAKPEVGERSKRLYALASELRRVGTTEETATARIRDLYAKWPEALLNTPGRDGRIFTWREAAGAIRDAYRGSAIKTYGCRSHFWDKTCPGADVCEFKKRLGNTRQPASELAAILTWVPKLSSTELRVYLALIAIEQKRGYKPGSRLFVAQREIVEAGKVARTNIADALYQLWFQGLVIYTRYQAQDMGRAATDVQRVVPIPDADNAKGRRPDMDKRRKAKRARPFPVSPDGSECREDVPLPSQSTVLYVDTSTTPPVS